MNQADDPFAVADSPRSRSHYYRHVCGLPTLVDQATGRITMRAGSTGAVMMPADLAQRVKIELDRRNEGPCPIIGQPRAGVWIYLVRSDLRPILDPAVLARLWQARVVVIRDGDIALPSPAPDQRVSRTWIAPASTPFRPSGTTVLDCVRECLAVSKLRPS
ncbi:DNA-directed RNA polymerase subunit beta [Nocardia sp. NPDC058666]|uniref:DNA-directed RNA polymerase subunit beta n=1 Tax=unclassified Nocardia TaxID=2637762 RepID=UPI0036652076